MGAGDFLSFDICLFFHCVNPFPPNYYVCTANCLYIDYTFPSFLLLNMLKYIMVSLLVLPCIAFAFPLCSTLMNTVRVLRLMEYWLWVMRCVHINTPYLKLPVLAKPLFPSLFWPIPLVSVLPVYEGLWKGKCVKYLLFYYAIYTPVSCWPLMLYYSL